MSEQCYIVLGWTEKVFHAENINVKYLILLISNFRHVLNIVCVLLGISPPSDCDLPTFWNPRHFHLQRLGVEY
jgi:hypothetical protein